MIVTNSKSNALNDESLPGAASTVQNAGQHLHEELGRADSSTTSPIKQNVTNLIDANDPFDPTFTAVGQEAAGTGDAVGTATGSNGQKAPLQGTGVEEVSAQGKAVSALGAGVEGVSLSFLPSLPYFLLPSSLFTLHSSLFTLHSSLFRLPSSCSPGTRSYMCNNRICLLPNTLSWGQR